ncbi:hypothetical protein BT69DRAFT_1401009 [Atractiella rhizophila]|nr:hypothetical protein BT69DRAFT_1401009 [Atractiella rhizophila]
MDQPKLQFQPSGRKSNRVKKPVNLARKNTKMEHRCRKERRRNSYMKYANQSGYDATRYLISESQSLIKSLNDISDTNSTLALSSLHLLSLIMPTTADEPQPLDEDDEFVHSQLNTAGIGGGAGISSFVKLWFETRKQHTAFPLLRVERLRYLNKVGATIVTILIEVGELEEYEEDKQDLDFVPEEEEEDGVGAGATEEEEDGREMNQATADAKKERRKEDGTQKGKTRAQKKKEQKKKKKQKVPGAVQVGVNHSF